MSSVVEHQLIPHLQFELLRQARGILRDEAAALITLAERLDSTFCAAVDAALACRGHIVVTGIGKAGLIGQKLAATLSSTGTPALFLHPVEAVHGDLGCLQPDDLLLALSNSGETEEVCRLIPAVRRMGVRVVAITATDISTLGLQADVTLTLGRLPEAGLHGLAPTTTTTAMLAIGDALALVLSHQKGFTPQQFALCHPGGSLGEKLKRVDEVMRRADQLRVDSDCATIRQVYQELQRPGRRTGAVMLVDSAGRLSGLFTDSDLVRLVEQHRESQLDRPIAEVMTIDPITIHADALLIEAVELLTAKKVSELPVVDDDGKPAGLIDITDVIGLMPTESPD